MLRLYDFRCRKCGEVRERIVREDESIHSLCCGSECDRLMPVVRVNMGAAGAYGYYDDTLEAYVESNRHRRELCREKGVTPKGDTPKPEGDAWV